MRHFRNQILVGIDSAEVAFANSAGWRGLQTACEISGQTGAGITVCVCGPGAGSVKLLGEMEVEFRDLTPAVTGVPWNFIAARAVLQNEQFPWSRMDLLVVPERNGLQAEFREMCDRTACPVWVMPHCDAHPMTGQVPTLLAVDDLGPAGEEVLDMGVSLASLLDARLLVVHELAGESRHDCPLADRREAAQTQLARRLSHTDYRTLLQGSQLRVLAGEAGETIESLTSELKVSTIIRPDHSHVFAVESCVLTGQTQRLSANRSWPCSPAGDSASSPQAGWLPSMIYLRPGFPATGQN